MRDFAGWVVAWQGLGVVVAIAMGLVVLFGGPALQGLLAARRGRPPPSGFRVAWTYAVLAFLTTMSLGVVWALSTLAAQAYLNGHDPEQLRLRAAAAPSLIAAASVCARRELARETATDAVVLTVENVENAERRCVRQAKAPRLVGPALSPTVAAQQAALSKAAAE